MMKKVLKSKSFKRSTGFIFACLLILAAVFLFTRPLLAPEIDEQVLGNKSDNNDEPLSFSENQITNEKAGEGVEAEIFLVFDKNSGQTIASRNSQTPVAIASITKLMTAYVVNNYGSFDDSWAITTQSTGNIRPLLELQIGDKVKVEDLVNSTLIGSANDAAAALGAYLTNLAGKPAEELMNAEAEKLGMKSTHYENPIGFDSEQNYSTAEDLKILIRKITDLNWFTALDRKQSYSFISETGQSYFVKATNNLIAEDPELHAIKTGSTDEALGAMITSVKHNDSEFVMIVLRSPDRESDTKTLKANIIKNNH